MSTPFTFAGDLMTITEDEAGTAHITFDDRGTGRRCGDCQLCCKLLPIPPLAKPAGTKCVHAKVGKGCTIYPTRPMVCRAWSCRWLADPDARDLHRPDRGHYVVDISYDTVIVHDADGIPTQAQVLQVWIDPAYPQAHRAPELRAYMARRAAEHGIATIVRFNSRTALVVTPPAITKDRQWMELTTVINPNLPERETFHRNNVSVTFEKPP